MISVLSGWLLNCTGVREIIHIFENDLKIHCSSLLQSKKKKNQIFFTHHIYFGYFRYYFFFFQFHIAVPNMLKFLSVEEIVCQWW